MNNPTTAPETMIPLPKLAGRPVLQCQIPLTPIPASRPRAVENANNRFSKKNSGITVYTSPRYRKYQTALHKYFKIMRRPCDPGCITSIACEFVVPVPGQIQGVRLTAAEKAQLAGDFCFEDNIGDWDNLAKPILDAMQELGWLLNDSQVGSGLIAKRYAHPGEETKTILTIFARPTPSFGRWKKN